PDVGGDPAEVGAVVGLAQWHAGRPDGAVPDRLDEDDVVPQPAEAEQVLQDRPGGAALAGVAGDHAAQEDGQVSSRHRSPAYNTCSNIRPSTLSESKYSSARARAARLWRP